MCVCVCAEDNGHHDNLPRSLHYFLSYAFSLTETARTPVGQAVYKKDRRPLPVLTNMHTLINKQTSS